MPTPVEPSALSGVEFSRKSGEKIDSEGGHSSGGTDTTHGPSWLVGSLPYIDPAPLFNQVNSLVAIGNPVNANVTSASIAGFNCPSDAAANSGSKFQSTGQMGPNMWARTSDAACGTGPQVFNGVDSATAQEPTYRRCACPDV